MCYACAAVCTAAASLPWPMTFLSHVYVLFLCYSSVTTATPPSRSPCGTLSRSSTSFGANGVAFHSPPLCCVKFSACQTIKAFFTFPGLCLQRSRATPSQSIFKPFGFMFFMKNVYTQVSLKGSFPLFVPFTVLQPPPTIHTIPCLLLLSTQPCGLCLVLALFVGAADGAIGVGVGVGVVFTGQAPLFIGGGFVCYHTVPA